MDKLEGLDGGGWGRVLKSQVDKKKNPCQLYACIRLSLEVTGIHTGGGGEILMVVVFRVFFFLRKSLIFRTRYVALSSSRNSYVAPFSWPTLWYYQIAVLYITVMSKPTHGPTSVIV